MPQANLHSPFLKLHSQTLTHSRHIKYRQWLALYHRRFPYQELAPSPMIEKSLEKGHVKIMGLYDRKNIRWAGFTLMEDYQQHQLLAYLSTAECYEGQGLARRLVNQSLQDSLSVERPYYWLEASPKLWKFYRKLGFKRLAINYRIPEFYGSGTEQMGLFIRLHSSVQQISKVEVRAFVQQLFQKGYDITSDDKRYQAQMAEIDAYPHSVVATL